MRKSLALLALLAVVGFLALEAAAPAKATPSKTGRCTNCHGVDGTV